MLYSNDVCWALIENLIKVSSYSDQLILLCLSFLSDDPRTPRCFCHELLFAPRLPFGSPRISCNVLSLHSVLIPHSISSFSLRQVFTDLRLSSHQTHQTCRDAFCSWFLHTTVLHIFVFLLLLIPSFPLLKLHNLRFSCIQLFTLWAYLCTQQLHMSESSTLKFCFISKFIPLLCVTWVSVTNFIH